MELRVSLLRIRILVGVGGAEEDAFAQVHQAHEHAGDYELYAACSQMPRPLRAPRYSAVAAVAKM